MVCGRTSWFYYRLSDDVTKKSFFIIFSVILLPAVLWTSIMYIVSPATGIFWCFKPTINSTEQGSITAFQPIPDSDRHNARPIVVIMAILLVLQLLTTSCFYIKICYDSYVSTMKVNLKRDANFAGEENKNVSPDVSKDENFEMEDTQKVSPKSPTCRVLVHKCAGDKFLDNKTQVNIAWSGDKKIPASGEFKQSCHQASVILNSRHSAENDRLEGKENSRMNVSSSDQENDRVNLLKRTKDRNPLPLETQVRLSNHNSHSGSSSIEGNFKSFEEQIKSNQKKNGTLRMRKDISSNEFTDTEDPDAILHLPEENNKSVRIVKPQPIYSSLKSKTESSDVKVHKETRHGFPSKKKDLKISLKKKFFLPKAEDYAQSGAVAGAHKINIPMTKVVLCLSHSDIICTASLSSQMICLFVTHALIAYSFQIGGKEVTLSRYEWGNIWLEVAFVLNAIVDSFVSLVFSSNFRDAAWSIFFQKPKL